MFRAVTSNLRDASVASGLDSCNLGNAGHQRQVSPLASQPASCESGERAAQSCAGRSAAMGSRHPKEAALQATRARGSPGLERERRD